MSPYITYQNPQFQVTEEKWRPYELDSEASLNRYVGETADLGLSIEWAISTQRPHCLNIAQSALQFARVAHSLARDFALLNASCPAHLQTVSDAYMRTIWCEYLFHLITAPESDVLNFTCRFIVGQVVPSCDRIYHHQQQGERGIIQELLPEKFPSLLRFKLVSNSGASFDEEVANV